MQRARTGRRAPGHLREITLRPWVMFPRLVWCILKASCMCACPIPQAPPALPSLCRGWFQQACVGQHAPVYPREISPGPWAPPLMTHYVLSGPCDGGSEPFSTFNYKWDPNTMITLGDKAGNTIEVSILEMLCVAREPHATAAQDNAKAARGGAF